MITYGGGSAKRSGVLDEVKTALQGYDIDEFARHRAQSNL